ncbi:hypothetical protein F2Q70_00045465 [Brassica cretica]|uniref:Uncharacterized protein n=1 Tax=Brassica cretica TaxID=69181 RepID=A0A8S9KKC7_BRACR|nr:hypothetical protein F2Q70_00045465 [Brassica cretica]
MYAEPVLGPSRESSGFQPIYYKNTFGHKLPDVSSGLVDRFCMHGKEGGGAMMIHSNEHKQPSITFSSRVQYQFTDLYTMNRQTTFRYVA